MPTLPTLPTVRNTDGTARPWGIILNTSVTIMVIVAATLLAVLHAMSGEVVAGLFGTALGHATGVTARRRPDDTPPGPVTTD